ncbi:MobA/MobL family protein [Bifidobacterium longum subsp. suis]|nr:MobA/MobL family protein [Bifidobacterium longum subsp. suis]
MADHHTARIKHLCRLIRVREAGQTHRIAIQYKTEKEYLCVKDGEERGFTASEFKAAQVEGWEKQYPYKVGKKKVYTAPSAAQAHGYVRMDKHPKSTRYGRQNPISERWNSEEQLIVWREAWATAANRCLELAGHDSRIDHRSHAERGLEERPHHPRGRSGSGIGAPRYYFRPLRAESADQGGQCPAPGTERTGQKAGAGS